VNRRPPPKKQKKKEGDPPKPRRFDGALKDVTSEALALGITEKTLWSRVTRRRIPYRKDHGRVVFLHDEVLEFYRRLPGVTMEQALENVAARQGEERAQ
jgi:hypothetical protein